MTRRYARRITKKERRGLDTLYGIMARSRNRRDAFSHSEQCDTFYEVISSAPGGVPHVGCRCWCHHAENLWNTSEPELDFTPPPEYLNSADKAFSEIGEPAYMQGNPSPTTAPEPLPVAAETVWSVPQTGAVNIASCTGFTNWSREELASGRCSNCNDMLIACECVE